MDFIYNKRLNKEGEKYGFIVLLVKICDFVLRKVVLVFVRL